MGPICSAAKARSAHSATSERTMISFVTGASEVARSACLAKLRRLLQNRAGRDSTSPMCPRIESVICGGAVLGKKRVAVGQRLAACDALAVTLGRDRGRASQERVEAIR